MASTSKAGHFARGVEKTWRLKRRKLTLAKVTLWLSVLLVLSATFIFGFEGRMLGDSAVFVIFAVVIVAAVLTSIINAKKRRIIAFERKAARGAEAEESVSSVLEELLPDCRLFHNVKMGNSFGDVDHIVVNRDGVVFLVETKSQKGVVTYNGSTLLIDGNFPRKDFIRQVLERRDWLEKELKDGRVYPFIKPILVFTRAEVWMDGYIKGILVIEGKDLLEAIRNVRSYYGIFNRERILRKLETLAGPAVLQQSLDVKNIRHSGSLRW